MSGRTVIGTVKSCLEHATFGLAAKVALLAGSAVIGADKIRLDFNFSDSRAPAMLNPTTSPQVGVRPLRWEPGHRTANLRDGIMMFEIRVEYFGADADVVKENADVCADALALVIDDLRDYSDLVGGPVIDVLAINDRIAGAMMAVVFGQFEDPASTGFLATIQVLERTTYA